MWNMCRKKKKKKKKKLSDRCGIGGQRGIEPRTTRTSVPGELGGRAPEALPVRKLSPVTSARRTALIAQTELCPEASIIPLDHCPFCSRIDLHVLISAADRPCKISCHNNAYFQIVEIVLGQTSPVSVLVHLCVSFSGPVGVGGSGGRGRRRRRSDGRGVAAGRRGPAAAALGVGLGGLGGPAAPA